MRVELVAVLVSLEAIIIGALFGYGLETAAVVVGLQAFVALRDAWKGA